MIHTIDKDKGTSRTHFDSVNELIETINSKGFDVAKQQASSYMMPEFHGVKTFDEGIKLQQTGYVPKGGFDLDIEVRPTLEVKEHFEMDFAGIMPDVGVFLSGEPQCMVNYIQSDAEVKILKIAVQCNCNGGWAAKDLIKHSEEVFHAIRWAQSKGYQVELVALMYNCMGSVTETFTITLMKAGDVLSASRIAAAIHVSLFRCLWFAWAYKSYGNCGGSKNPPKEIDGYKVIPSTEFLKEKKMSVHDAVKQIVEQTSIPA
jgi:hypothetical protein